MSRANEEVSTPRGSPVGGMETSLGKSPDLEPTTPQGPAAKPSDFPTETHAWESDQPQQHQEAQQQQQSASSSQETAAAKNKQDVRASASDIVSKASTKATEARQYAGEAAERTKEAARQAAGVAKIHLHRAVIVGKEKMGIPAEKPLLHAAKEKMGIPPDLAAREAARQITQQTALAAKDKLYSIIIWLFTFLATLPATIQELHDHGKRLAEEKDRAMAQQQQAPSSSELTESILNAKAPIPSSQNPVDSSKPQEKGAALPVPREHVDQSEAGTTAVREEGETERRGFIDTASGGGAIDESGLHSLK